MLKTFEDVLIIKNGKNQKAVENPNGQYPIYGSGGVMGRADDYICEANTVVIGRKGSINNPIFVEEPFWNVDTAFGLVADEKQLLSRYLYYFCRHFDFEKLNTTVTIPSLTKANLLKIQIEVPDKKQQAEIVGRLQRIETVLVLHKKQLAKLDELVKARFVEMFGECDYPYLELISLITEGAGLSYGIVQPGDDGTGDMGVLRPVDFVGGKISTGSIKYIDRSIGDGFKKTELRGDELLITVRGSTGITALTDQRFSRMNVTRGIAVIRYDRNKINPIYLNAYLNTDESQQYIQEHTRGATLQQINLADLKMQRILMPPRELQEQFSKFAIQVDQSKAVVQKALDKAQLLFDSLMQEYFG